MYKKLVFPLLFILDPGHEHSYTETVTEPTCTEQGYTTYTCSCGDSYEGNIVPALGHDFVLIGQNGTTATYQCSQCGYTYNEIVTPNPPVEEISLDLDEGCSDRTLVSTITERHEYVYASGRLMREIITTTSGTTTSTEVLDFIYGSGSTPLALVYTNGTASPVTYYYVTNMQGDVVRLVTAGGTVVASYTYDAWGRVLSATGSMAEVNPIQYRGYYYDAEIGMYYLQSRYYDPAVRRFINADGITSTEQGFLGYNMFTYCGNSPICRIDETGCAWWWIIPIVFGPLFLTACSDESSDSESSDGPPEDYVNDPSTARNCYTYAFGLTGKANPGTYSMTLNDPTSYMSYIDRNAYTLEEITAFVMQDMEAMGRDVRLIDSLDELRDGEYAVALKTSSMLVPGMNFADYHFAVLLSDGTWADKCGEQPSRWNKIDGLADTWDLGSLGAGNGYYNSDTQLFAVCIGG